MRQRNWATDLHDFNPRSPWGERPVFGKINVIAFIISIHAPRGGSDLYPAVDVMQQLRFQSTLPVGGATRNAVCRQELGYISIPAPRGGSDPVRVECTAVFIDFNPRSPWGERRYTHIVVLTYGLFQSTLPVGGATGQGQLVGLLSVISIHAPRGGSDCRRGGLSQLERDFNPRSPWGERLQRHICMQVAATISIHAPRGGSDRVTTTPYNAKGISIHAPRGGSDYPHG